MDLLREEDIAWECEINGIDYAIPEYMREGMLHYINHGILPGDFGHLILLNDFVHACQFADKTNITCLPAYACFLLNEIPANMWGSAKNINKHILSRRLQKEEPSNVK